jgi:predicted DNA-binding protein
MDNNQHDKTTLIQMRLQPKTMERINNLTEITGTTNRTLLIANSIELTEELLKNAKEGAKIYIERKDGTKELLKIVGM